MCVVCVCTLQSVMLKCKSFFFQVCLFFGDFAISVILAIILNLTLESPLMALDKIIFRRRKWGFSIVGKVDIEKWGHGVNWVPLTADENSKISKD